MSVSRESYLALSRCHAIILRSGNNPELVKQLDDWLDENLDNIEDETQEPEHISTILERCVSDLIGGHTEGSAASGR